MWRRTLSSTAWLLAGGLAMGAPAMREAPNMAATPVNQRVVAGNACGPAALLNAFRLGNRDWQRAANAVAGATDKERVLTIIRGAGMRPSKHVPGHPRWSRCGVNVADLRDMANELTLGLYLPPLNEEVLFRRPRESPQQFLQRVYQRCATSFGKGLPPVISLRRYAWRRMPGKDAQWMVIDAHFVTLTAIPRTLDKQARTFEVAYIDPWGAQRCRGSIGLAGLPVMTDTTGEAFCLEADFPQAAVGKARVRSGEKTALVLAAAIGRW